MPSRQGEVGAADQVASRASPYQKRQEAILGRGKMSLGTILGVADRAGMTASPPPGVSCRILAIVGDAFGGHGGIAQYNRDFLSALVNCGSVDEIVVVPRLAPGALGTLPSGVRQLPPVGARVGYVLTVLWALFAHRPIHLIFCGHVLMVPLAAVMARVLGVPLWLQVHGIEVWKELSTLHRRAIESASLVTAVSRYTKHRMLEWVGIEPYRVKVLPNTVDPRYSPGPKPEYLLERHALYGRRVLLTVARLAASQQHKGHDRVLGTMARVLARHHDTSYLIVGGGDDRPRLEALAREYGVSGNVQFAGMVPAQELPDYFRLADVFVMPSVGDGFGIAFLEAAATGIHVIGGNRDGSRDALCDGALGTLVDPDNLEELAAAIEAALDNTARTIDRTDRFKRERFVSHVDALYQFCVSRCAAKTE